MALVASYFTAVTAAATTSTSVYTSSATAYNRDLVVTNGGASTCFVAVGPAVTAAASTGSFELPAGQSIVLMGQLPASSKVFAIQPVASAGTLNVSLGWASVVSVI